MPLIGSASGVVPLGVWVGVWECGWSGATDWECEWSGATGSVGGSVGVWVEWCH